jgi:restriction endonuclease Mrr
VSLGPVHILSKRVYSRGRAAVILQITERGKSVLAENPKAIDNELLSRFPAFNDFRERSGPAQGKPPN